MSLEPSKILALILVGLVIKLMDDYLDYAEEEVGNSRRTLGGQIIHQASRGIISYTLVGMILAILCDQKIALAFFFSAYAIGMLSYNQNEKLPSGLYPWLESLAIIGLGHLSAGILFWTALSATISIQALDDLVDFRKDITESRSWCTQFGSTGTGLIFVGSALVGLFLDTTLTLLAITFSRLLARLMDQELTIGGEHNGKLG